MTIIFSMARMHRANALVCQHPPKVAHLRAMRLSIVCILVSMAQCLCAQHDVLRFTGTIGLWEKDSTLHGALPTAVKGK